VLDIREKIGQRLLAARKAKGLTRKALAERTEDLKPSRINNWERGTRIPGPLEIKQLARILEVSPAFLMCLTEERDVSVNANYLYAPLKKSAFFGRDLEEQLDADIAPAPIAVNKSLSMRSHSEVFAIQMTNDSMTPEIRPGDLLIINPGISPRPGDFIAVNIREEEELVICLYKKLSYEKDDCELITLNENWPNIQINGQISFEIIGKIVQIIRNY
jgi:SOS-response transcriptional repressor LexA